MAGSRKRPTTELPGAVAALLSGTVRPGQSLAVALSGGVDSVVLLHLVRRFCQDFPCELQALHVDHGLSAHSPQWAAFCERLCRQWEIPLRVDAVKVDPSASQGLEAAARDARYRVLAAAGTDWLLTAHHRDDQIETVFLNLLRGAGPRGLAGMPAAQAEPLNGASGPRLLRPLLAVPRGAILAYARAHGLDWVEDESNRDTDLRRNFLRHEILPALARRFPGFDAPVLRSARWLAEAVELMDILAAADLERCADGQSRLDVQALGSLDDVRSRNLLRFWLRRQGRHAPDAGRLQEMLRQLTSAAPDAALRINVEGWTVRRYRGRACLVSPCEPLPAAICWRGETQLAWGSGNVTFRLVRGAGISAAALGRGAVALKLRAGSERLRLAPGRPRRSLKHLLQESGIPPWERDRMPLLWCGEALVWVPGVGIAAEFHCPPGDGGWLPEWTGV